MDYLTWTKLEFEQLSHGKLFNEVDKREHEVLLMLLEHFGVGYAAPQFVERYPLLSIRYGEKRKGCFSVSLENDYKWAIDYQNRLSNPNLGSQMNPHFPSILFVSDKIFYFKDQADATLAVLMAI